MNFLKNNRLMISVSHLLITSVLLTFSASALAAVLAGWDVSTLSGGTNNFGISPLTATTSTANLTVGGLTRGSGVGTTGSAASRAWGGNGWTSTTAAAAVTANDTVTFTITAQTGYQVSFSSISRFDYRRSSAGADNGVLQYQIGNGTFIDITTLSYSSTASGGASLAAIDLSNIAALQNVPAGSNVTFRIVNYRPTGGTSTGTWYIYDQAGSTASDLEISGTVTASGPAADGVCGSANGQTFAAAPTTNLCNVGSASSLTGSGPWGWTCSGINGGNAVNCSASSSVLGTCP